MSTIEETLHGSGQAASTATPAVLSESERRERAIRRVAAIKGFYTHLAVFLIVTLGLFVVDFLAGSDWWVQWVLLGWGIGVAAHALAVFGRASRLVAEWEDRKIRQIMAESRG